ncbi:gp58-like family protein, partial [uncultured Megasphaera sp.]|uniref:gp58-like family protein n=1 Tax=uncultured Megasphaera sp. TaxID=165188 RepID=UPI002598E2AE
TIESAVQNNGKSLSALSQRADTIESTVQNNGKSLSALSQRADTIESTVQNNGKSLSALSQRADTIESTVQNNGKSLSALSQRADRIESTVQTAKSTLESRITQQADRITSVVGNLSSVESAKAAGYTAITQLQDAIGLKVSKGDVKSEVALGLQGVTLSGKQVHITGDTVIDKDVITKGMIQAGAITGDKLDVKDLSSITANIGVLRTKSTGARMEIRDNCILIYDEQNRLRVRMGVWAE